MRGGATNYFPLPDTITNGAELQRQVHFINVVGHGSLTGQAFMVPENTYILFMGAAGFPIIRRPFQLPSLKRYRFLNEGETPEQWYTRTYAAIRDRTFFRDMLFKNDAPYAPDTTAIYEPGDIVQDLSLSFENPTAPYMLMGIWDCPIPADVGQEFDSENSTIELAKQEAYQVSKDLDELEKTMQSLDPTKLPRSEVTAIVQRRALLISRLDELDRTLAGATKRGIALQDNLVGKENNVGVKYMKLANWNRSSLSEVVQKLGNAFDASKPIRFIVVEACRSIGGSGMNELASLALRPGSASMSLVMRHMRNNEKGKNIPKPELEVAKGYEQIAQQRRRASLYARRTNAPSAAPGGAAGGAAAPIVYMTPSFRFTVQDLERVADRVPNGARLLGDLKRQEPVSVDALEASLETYIKPSRNLITADVKSLVSGLMPEQRFSPREVVTLPDGSVGVVVQPISEEGYIKYRVLSIDSTTGGLVDTAFEPTQLKKGADEELKSTLPLLFQSISVDSDAIIDAAEAEAVARLEGARTAESAFAATLPPLRTGPGAGSAWSSWESQGVPQSLKAHFEALSPKHQFKSGEKAKTNDAIPAKWTNLTSGENVIVTGLRGIEKDGVFKGLAYTVMKIGYTTMKDVRPDMLNKVAAGGRRKTQKRRRVNRKKSRRNRK